MLAELKKLTKHSAIYGIGKVTNQVLRFVMLPIYASFLNPSQYGDYSLLLVTANIFTLLAIMGLSSGLFREVLYKDSDEQTALSTAFFFLVGESSLVAGVLLLAAPLIAELLLNDVSQAPLLRMILVANWFSLLDFIVMSKLRIHTRSVLYSVITVANFTLGLGLNIVFVVFLNMNVFGLVVASLIVSVIFLAVDLIILIPDLKLTFSPKILRSLLNIGIPGTVFSLAMVVMTSADRYFLEYHVSSSAVGLYSMAYNVGMAIRLAISAIQLAWPAQMFQIAKEPGGEIKLARMFTYYLTVMGFLGLGLAILAREVLAILAPRYIDATFVIPFVVLSYIAYGCVYQTNIALDIRNKSKYMIPITIAAAGLNLLLNALLIPTMGMMGAAWSTLFSYLFLFLVEFIVNQRVWYIPYEYGRVAKIGVTWFTILAISNLLQIGNPWINAVLKLILLTMFPLMLYALNFFTQREINTIRKLTGDGLHRVQRIAGRILGHRPLNQRN